MKNMGRILLVGVLLVFGVSACAEEASNKAAEKTPAAETSEKIALDVYKSPTCGCCGKWVEHAEQRGFSLSAHHPEDLNQLKTDKGIAPALQSCHTAVSEQGFVFEGHIPARYIHDFLAKPPAGARGLAVPAMPLGSPGMEVDTRFMPYEVLLLKEDGSTEVFARVTSPAQQYH